MLSSGICLVILVAYWLFIVTLLIIDSKIAKIPNVILYARYHLVTLHGFLIFHMVSITGEKMAKEGAIEVMRGMWMASAILLPIGLFFTFKATSDSALFSMDNYLQPVKKLFAKAKKKEADE